MDSHIETINPKPKVTIEQTKIRIEAHLKRAISQLRLTGDAVESKLSQLRQFTDNTQELNRQLEKETNPGVREKLKFEKRELAEQEDHLRSTFATEKYFVV